MNSFKQVICICFTLISGLAIGESDLQGNDVNYKQSVYDIPLSSEEVFLLESIRNPRFFMLVGPGENRHQASADVCFHKNNPGASWAWIKILLLKQGKGYIPLNEEIKFLREQIDSKGKKINFLEEENLSLKKRIIRLEEIIGIVDEGYEN
ncbi:MAG: hypothetical protein AAF443_04775 [Chlamydiota bacterium]